MGNLILCSPPQSNHSSNRSKGRSQQKWKKKVPVDTDDSESKSQDDGAESSADISLLNVLSGKVKEYRLKDNATILYHEKFLDESRVQSLWKELMTLNWEQSSFKTRSGNTVYTPRLQSWMRDEGITNKMASLYQKNPGYPWSESISVIKNAIESMLHCKFQYVLINQYRNGRDSIAWHHDDEAQAKCSNVVGSVSLGGPRRFLLRHVHHAKLGVVGRREFLLSSGCLLVMKDDTQIMWKHAVPKDAKHQNPRINLTFRQVCRGCKLCWKRRR